MCGIYGILSLADGRLPTGADLDGMAEWTHHRGPDDEGHYAGEGIAFGMRRLSIIDLAGGKQPIASEDGGCWVVCNGEIYNFRELRDRLKRQGHVFKTGSDSEVVLHAYEEHGDGFIRQLDGMFGFALWDSRRRRLLVGRDRLGIKPIYYRVDDARLIFASELKAILRAPGVEAELDPEALDHYLALGYTPAPYSILRGIRKLPIGTMMVAEGGKVRFETYWRPESEVDESLSEEDWAARVREQLEKSIVSQMVSDVPIGAFLSGGIDSSAVVAFMARHAGAPVRTYSIGFDAEDSGSYFNETPYARKAADLFRTKHREIIVRPDVSKLLPKLLWHMDEPIADSAFITTYLVAEFARQDVKVILSGVGGDELFGGYRRYLGEHYVGMLRWMPRWVRRGILKPLARALPSDRHSAWMNFSRYARAFLLSLDLPFEERYRAYMGVFSEEQRRRLLASGAAGGRSNDAMLSAFTLAKSRDALNRLIEVDLSTQLPDDLLLLTDKMTMATSLECRVPLLDQALVDLSLRMPGRMKVRGRTLKYILKRALDGVLPPEILHRQKRGFGAPMGAWIKKELAPLLGIVLSAQAVERRGVFSWDELRRTIELHQANREDHTDHLLALMHFEIWCRLYLDGASPEELTAQLLSELEETRLAKACAGS
jgi:asparagine synthase (glutamine-hydrolysing)